MKKTQFIDLLRNIKKQKVSFLSIVAIAAIGMTTFLGIDYTATALRKNASEMYNCLNFRDIEVASTLLFSREDLASIQAVEGVEDAEAQRLTEAKLVSGKALQNVNVLSLSERINLTQTVQGRLPEAADECAVEQKTATELGIEVGDRIELQDPRGNTPQYLLNKEYTVTGTVNHPDHTNTIVPGTPYVLVPWDAFDDAALDGSFMKAQVLICRDRNVDRFSESYDKAVGEVLQRIEAISFSCAAKRDETVRELWDLQLEEGQEKLDEAEEQLTEARQVLNEKSEELKNGEEEIRAAESLLFDGKEQLDKAWSQLETARAQLDAAKRQMDPEKRKLDEGKALLDAAAAKVSDAREQLTDGFSELEGAKEKIRSAIRSAFDTLFPNETLDWSAVRTADPDDPDASAKYLWIINGVSFDLTTPIEDVFAPVVYSEKIPEKLLVALYALTQETDPPMIGDAYDMDAIRATLLATAANAMEGYAKLSQACIAWEAGHSEYIAGLREYLQGLEQYEAGLALYNEAKAKYDKGVETFRKGLAQYRAKEAEYNEGTAQLEEGKKQLAEGKQLIAEAQAEYENGVAAYESGKAQLEEAKEEIENADPCRWLSFDTKGSASFVQLTVGSGNFSNLRSTFSLMFVLVGALVIFATVGKMVDEQRTQIGTTKALGFFNREIFAKYLGFGVTATVVGTLLGILIAYLFIEPIMLAGFNKMYIVDLTKPILKPLPSLLALLAGILLATVAVWLASTKLLRQPAIRLMLPKAPEGKKKSAGKSRLSLYARLILLNMRTDLKRVIVTIVSVAGCCALVVIGITIRSGLRKAGEVQYSKITTYDVAVHFNQEASDTAADDLKRVMDGLGCESVPLTKLNITYRIDKLQVAELLCCDTDELQAFFHVDDWKTGEPIRSSDNGVLIQRRIAEYFGLGVGDTFRIAVDGVKEAKVRVDGIFENHIGRLVIISADYYRMVFKEDAAPNAFYVRLNGESADALDGALREVEGYEGMTSADADNVVIRSTTSSINTVVVLFIFVAGILACVVQLNLTNMYVLQKKPELIIMRVNGFTTKEVIRYILQETVVTTVVGILLGIGMGSVVAYSIIRTLEQSFFQFYRGVDPVAWTVGTVVTILFTVFVNAVALRKTKDLKLTDAA